MKKILNIFCTIKAFSLIELMISLITISCIVAAFTPVITKKLSSSSMGFGGSFKEVTTQCEKFGSDCSLCYPDKCIVCTKICSSTQYKDSKKCECKECSEIEGCLACNSTKCTKCKSGYGYSSSDFKCTKCSKGQYSDGTDECKPCPKGQYQPNEGSESCLKALQGQYVPIEGAKSPTPCPKGQYQPNEGRESCILCSKGQYQDELGQASCKSCEAGYYCNSEGMENMTPCPVGTYSPTTNAKESSVCTDCPEGKYAANQGSSSCTNCEGGKWSGIGYSTCSLTCSAGYACLNGIKTKCPINTYSTSGSSSCSPCASGKYSFSGSSTCLSCSSKISNCTSCSANSDGTVTCNACSGDLTPTKTGCIKVFTSQEWSDTSYDRMLLLNSSSTAYSRFFYIPEGVEKIRLTIVGMGGYVKGTSDRSYDKAAYFKNSTVIDLTSDEYSWMKEVPIRLHAISAGGTSGSGATFPGGILTEYYSATGGKGGGPAPADVQNFTLDSSINSLKIVVGKLGEGSPGELGTSNGTISGGSGGAGGGASYISDGTNILAAAAGSGGGGGASACSADGSFVAIGGAGGKGASIGSLEGGAGGAQNSSCIAGTHDGNAGKSGKYSGRYHGYDNHGKSDNDGYVYIVSQDYYSESNTAGNSGKCYYNPSINVTSGDNIAIRMKAGITSSAIVVIINGTEYSSDMGTYQNMASGDTPGAGFSGRCQPGTYGAGAEKKPAGYYRYLCGTGPYVLIENATEY